MIKIGKYEVEEVTKTQVFDPPKEMLVWSYREGKPDNAEVVEVMAIIGKLERHARVIYKFKGDDRACYWASHCGLIKSEVMKYRYATRRELARWLAQGNGQRTATNYADVHSDMWVYPKNCDNEPVDKDVLVRKWDDEEWHEATIDYLGIKEG